MAAVTLQKTLPTPAPTPRGSTNPPQTPPQRITQHFESGQGYAAQHTTPVLDTRQQDEDSPCELSQGLEGEGQPYQAHHGAAEESVPEQTGDALPVTTSEDGLAGIDGGPDHSPPQREGRPSRQAAQVAATLISQQLDTPNYRPPKRKHVPEVNDASSSALTTALDDAVSGTAGQGPDASRLCDSSSSPNPNDNLQDKQPDLLGSDRGYIPTSLASASLNRPESATSPAPSTHEGPP